MICFSISNILIYAFLALLLGLFIGLWIGSGTRYLADSINSEDSDL